MERKMVKNWERRNTCWIEVQKMAGDTGPEHAGWMSLEENLSQQGCRNDLD